MTTVLQLEQISKQVFNESDRHTTILNQINLTVNKGDFITVLGGNGAGKSTLFNAITGSTSVSGGQVSLKGKHLNTIKEEKRAAFIARVFQDPKMGTAPRMTVAENLLLALKRGQKPTLFSRGLNRHYDYFKSLCETIGNGLEEKLDVPTEQLSGGQRQSLSLLMATLTEPDVLLLDEHTAALDPKIAVRLMELTDQIIHEKQLTCLMITHRMEDALKYGNRLIVLEKGSIKSDLNEKEKSALSMDDLFHLFERDETPAP
ncbi:ATP-binding cassette domain-containing protein [Alkalibacterium sp. MB6]|uniref:ABC transporter ATP-binding protein n=1 Tax=Alkalibacterium sp. MB6 TaxID=2081965 RepID=UPI00137A50D5